MGARRLLLNKKILLILIAALLSGFSSCGYACITTGPTVTYSLCRAISLVGAPGILAAAALSIALLGAHGGGPLGMLLVIATPVNFFLYLMIGLAIRKVARLFTKPSR